MRKVEEIITDLKYFFSGVKINQGEDGMAVSFNYDGIMWCIIASWGMSWEHVSLHLHNVDRCPTWNEMCSLKNLFWKDDETVIQYHPSKEHYISVHPTTLHLWRCINQEFPTPPIFMV